MTKKPKPLMPFFEQRFTPERLAKKTAWVRHNHVCAILAFAKFLKHEPFLTDLTADKFEAFGAWLQRQKYATSTIRSRKGAVYAIWRAAHEAGLAREPVRQWIRRRPWEGKQRHFYKPVEEVKREATAVDSLEALINRYPIDRDVTEGTVSVVCGAVRRLGEYLGRPPMLSDLNDSTLNEWLLAMQQQTKLAPRSIRSARGALLTLWRFGFECEAVETLPKRVRKIKCPRTYPNAWTLEELQGLARTAAETKGRFGLLDVPRGPYWVAFIACGFFTALRLGDLLRLEFGMIEPSGWLTVTQSKTGYPMRCFLPPDAMAVVEAIAQPKRKLIFAAFGQRVHQQRFRVLVDRAELTGGAQKLRRTAATLIECAQPGAATWLLGHRDASLARRHYIDPTQVQQSQPRLPQLALIGGPED